MRVDWLGRWAVWVVILCVSFSAHAASYVYDANGRLRAVTDSSGATRTYNYDALGNITGIVAVPTAQLAVFAFTPSSGPAGTTVTISGQGFSATPGSNAVAFNGTAATVSAASASQLVVTVPGGATSGPVSVSVGSSLATSTDPFVVTSDGGGALPSIASFSPTLANPGTAISVNGNQFVTAAGSTLAGVNQNLTAVTPASNTQLTFSVGAPAGSGPVTVQTPYGQAQSSQPLIVLPAAIPVGNIVSASTLAIGGAPQTVTIGTAGKSAVAVFNGGNAQWLTLQFSNFSTSPAQNLNVSLYDPNGIDLFDGVIVPSVLSFDLPPLPAIGTYTLTFKPAAGGTAQFAIALEQNASLSIGGTTTIDSTVLGQSKRATFSGVFGQYLGIYVPSFSSVPAYAINEDVVGPADERLVPTPNNLSTFYNMPMLTEAGTGYVRLSQGYATFAAQLQLVANPSYALAVDGATVGESTAYANENAYTSYAAIQGQNLSLAFSNLATAPSGGYVYFSVTEPDGTGYGYGTFYAPGGHVLLKNAPQSGTYLVTAFGSQPASYGLSVSTVLSGTLNPDTPLAVALAKPGQIARYTFAGMLGQYVGLSLQSVATVPTGGNVTLTVYKPDGSALASGSGYTASRLFLNLPALPQAGVYTVQVDPDYADTATAQLTLTANPTATLTVDGVAVSQSTGVAGENTYATFAATAGQSVSFGLANVSTTPAGGYVYCTFTAPNGAYAGYAVAYAPGGHVLLNNLPQTGTYQVSCSPSGGDQTQTMAFALSIRSDVTGTLTPNSPVAVNLASAQVAQYTFNGSAGQYFGLALQNPSTTPPGGGVTLTTFKPTNGVLSGGSVRSTASTFFNLPVLPASGVYSLQVESDYADAMSAQVTLVPNPLDALTIGGPAASESTAYPAENTFATFAGTAGQHVTLNLANVATVPTGGYVYYVIYAPSGAYIAYGAIYAPGGQVALASLPQTGTYLIAFSPSGGQDQTMSYSATVTSP